LIGRISYEYLNDSEQIRGPKDILIESFDCIDSRNFGFLLGTPRDVPSFLLRRIPTPNASNMGCFAIKLNPFDTDVGLLNLICYSICDRMCVVSAHCLNIFQSLVVVLD
jgi:hypothetical protein